MVWDVGQQLLNQEAQACAYGVMMQFGCGKQKWTLGGMWVSSCSIRKLGPVVMMQFRCGKQDWTRGGMRVSSSAQKGNTGLWL